MQHNFKWKNSAYVIVSVLCIAELWALFRLYQTAIIPTKWILILLIAMGITTVFIVLTLFHPSGNFQKFTAYVLSAVMICFSLFGTPLVLKLRQTIQAVTQKQPVQARICVYVRNSDPAETIQDAVHYQFGVTQSYDFENTRHVLAAIAQTLGKTPETKKYTTVFALVDALYSEKTDAIILNQSYADLLQDTENYSDFSARTRILYESSLELPPETDSLLESTSPVPPNTPCEPFVIYLSGSDTRSSFLTRSRSDVNVLAAVNPRTRQILLVNTPRDTFLPNPAGNGAYDKLTHCGLYGTDCSVQALSQLYRQPIPYYGQINFSGFEMLIDAIGGITVYSDIAFVTTHGNHAIRQGENRLNGRQALGFARERYAFADGDNTRGENHMKVIAAVIEKLSVKTILTDYAKILDSLQGMFSTNMSAESITALIRFQLSDMPDWEIFSYAISGTGGSDITYSMPGVYAYVMYPDPQSVAQGSRLIEKVLNHQFLTERDLIF